ncbi:hypothetical protein [Brevibacillus sp. SAFN-007a]|uniref:hypothetical protein n=1 Tax=Brevibacillus sp. SAFN-007a TaxID=3436862 RepID=UPI003F7DF95C
MISAKERERLQNQMKRDESKIVNIVLHNTQQVAGEIEKATHQGIYLVDGHYYGYEEIQEINGSL